MQFFKKVLKILGYILTLPLAYLIISLALSWVTINNEPNKHKLNHTIFLSTNGVHLDIVVPINLVNDALLADIAHKPADRFLSFGWGDENFYLNTPTWGDLSFGTAFKAVFLKSRTLMHITRYEHQQSNWAKVYVSESQLSELSNYILTSFKSDANGKKIILRNKGYGPNDDFYQAKGSYSLFKTCNTWANTAFKESGMKACIWTPFDFGLLKKYE